MEGGNCSGRRVQPSKLKEGETGSKGRLRRRRGERGDPAVGSLRDERKKKTFSARKASDAITRSRKIIAHEQIVENLLVDIRAVKGDLDLRTRKLVHVLRRKSLV